MLTKFKLILYLIIPLLLISCQEKNPCNLSAEVLNDLNTLDSLVELPEDSNPITQWLKYNLHEPPLYKANTETYRFTLKSPFNESIVCRIEEYDGQYRAIKKVYTDIYDTTGIIKEFKISKEVWNNIVNTLAANNFWTYLHLSKEKAMYLDPTTITIEGYKPTKDKCTLKNYHFISRQSSKDTTFISMCKLFYELDKK